MKSLTIKILLIFNVLFFYSCKAQTANDYVPFYNNVVPKLNTIVPNKTQFYGQNFSSFYAELLNKQLYIVEFSCDYKTDPGSKFFVLRLFFAESDMWSAATNNSFQYPWISITFENEIPNQITAMARQTQGQWNSSFVQFFSNMKIEKIKFVGINGYNSADWTEK
ncbi:hypothetical protein [Chryseobacterium wangxinyae]|uniref:hypothetical protein n=1 Tax=Chryseobacterium sp. CY353 TaxID=2997334 RepID=UPI00226F63A1|nr:hypothetical protein [Chryseobacterium sp. CY353]MCY0969533.1 hypothetical protein [Chryseobacterium sp. CY353]